MILVNYLEQVDPDARLYIGSKSGFFFIGTKDEFIEFVDREKIDKQFLKNFRSCLRKAKTDLANLEKMIPKYKAKLETCKDLKKLEQLNKDIRSLERSLKSRKSAIVNYEKAIETYTPVLDRKIIYVYYKVTMPDEQGIAIKLKGYEASRYWTYGEWKDEHTN